MATEILHLFSTVYFAVNISFHGQMDKGIRRNTRAPTDSLKEFKVRMNNTECYTDAHG